MPDIVQYCMFDAWNYGFYPTECEYFQAGLSIGLFLGLLLVVVIISYLLMRFNGDLEDKGRKLNLLEKLGITTPNCSKCLNKLEKTAGFCGSKTYYHCSSCGEYELIEE